MPKQMNKYIKERTQRFSETILIMGKKYIKFPPAFNQRGIASMAEIVLVGGIFLMLLTIGILGLSREPAHANISTTVDTFLSDFKEQQIKAMEGDSDGGAGPDNYGIYFGTTSYSLFRGATSSADLNKFVVNLPPTVTITNFFPDNQIIFLKGIGEVANCCTGANFQVTFNDLQSNIGKTITVNRMGAFTTN